MYKCVIALAADKNYLPFVIPLIRDLKDKVELCPPIFLFYDGDQKDLIQVVEFSKLKDIHLELIDISDELTSDLHNTVRYLTRTTFARLFIPKYLARIADRVLYLDIDLMVIGDFSFVFSIEMSQIIAAVPENFDSMNIAFGSYNFAYFNAGVLLIDVEKWNSNRILEKTTLLLEEKGPFNCQDQDALNLIFENAWQVLPPTLNVMVSTHDHSLDLPQLGNPLLVHFVGASKPWKKPHWTRWHKEWNSRNSVYLEEIGLKVEHKLHFPNVYEVHRQPITHRLVGIALRLRIVIFFVQKFNLKSNVLLRRVLRLPKWRGDV